MSAQIHASAVIDEGAIIGPNTQIWHFCHVMAGATIGSGCIMGQNTFVASTALIGNHVKIQNNVSVYDGVTLEDDVFVGPSVVFTNVSRPRSFINQKSSYLSTRVCKGASLGANATVICGVTIGQYAMIGAGAVITNSVPAFALMVGNPARHVGWVSMSGKRLEITEGETIYLPEEGVSYQLKDNVLTLK